MTIIPPFSLSPDIEYVMGSNHTLMLNFKTGSTDRLDLLSGQILSFIKKGCLLDQIALQLKQSPHFVKAHIKDLRMRGIVEPFPLPMNEMKKLEPPRLNCLWLEITGRCNLNCIHCYALASKAKSPHLDLQYGIIAKTIREGAELGCSCLQFTGGEPTLRKDLKRLIHVAKDNGIPKIEVFSNGVSMTEPMIDFFSREEISLAISFYSHRAKIHDSITGVQGSQRLTLRNLKRIVQKGIPIRCEMIMMKANRNDFPGVHELLSSMGIDLSNSHPILPIGRSAQAKVDLDWAAYSKIISNRTFCPDICDFNRRKNWNACWCGKASMAFNGDVTPCIFAREQVAGNVKHEGLAHIIKGKMQEYWSLNKDKVNVCRDCEYRYSCNDCPPLTYSLTESLTAKPPYCRYDPYSGVLEQ